jgi:hypothetical protein
MVEAVVTLSDLPRVQALAFINSLRGWVDAKLAPSPRIDCVSSYEKNSDAI